VDSPACIDCEALRELREAREKIALLELANAEMAKGLPGEPLVVVGHCWVDRNGPGVRFVVFDPTGNGDGTRRAMRDMATVVEGMAS